MSRRACFAWVEGIHLEPVRIFMDQPVIAMALTPARFLVAGIVGTWGYLVSRSCLASCLFQNSERGSTDNPQPILVDKQAKRAAATAASFAVLS